MKDFFLNPAPHEIRFNVIMVELESFGPALAAYNMTSKRNPKEREIRRHDTLFTYCSRPTTRFRSDRSLSARTVDQEHDDELFSGGKTVMEIQ